MAQFTNAQILSAVVNKWAQPLVQTFAGMKLQTIPFISNLEAKLKSTGWFSPNWSISNDIAPLFQPITGSLIEPMLNKYLSQIDDAEIPKMAHTMVDNLMSQEQIVLLEGKVTIEKSDLEALKKLLNFNLPLNESNEQYIVKEE